VNAPKDTKLEPIIAKLHEILEIVESGESDIADSMKAYEEGVTLIRQAREYLEAAEQRIEIISREPGDDEVEAGE
jgi:exodeoxyribonuclease VII small subunit